MLEEHLGACQLVHTAAAVCTSIGWGVDVEGPPDADASGALVSLGLAEGDVDEMMEDINALRESTMAFAS